MSYEYRAIVKTILDANTVELAVDLGFGLTIRRVFAIIGMTAPTFRGAKSPKEVVEAERAKKVAIQVASGAKVLCKSRKMAKYGRYSAELVFEDGETYPEKLARQGVKGNGIS